MTRVELVGRAEAQFHALPEAVRRGLEWAFTELERDPATLPNDSARGIETKRLGGAPALYRVAIRTRPGDPGYRAIYCVTDDAVLFLRFARRDAATYRGMRQLGQFVQRLD